MADRVWFITGASRGLGLAFTEAAVEHGDRVAATVRRESDESSIRRAFGGDVLPLRLDVTDRSAVFACVDRAVTEFGALDVLVNNAGYGLAGAVEEVSEEQARRQLEVNVLGVLWCTQAVLPVMRRQRAGHIVQISSLGGTTAFPGTGLYHASKWALEGMSESLALEVAPFGIHVTMLEPGPFRTDWNGTSMDRAQPLAAYDGILAERRHQLSGAFAGSQPGDPRRVARALLDVLASQEPPKRLLLGNTAADVAPPACQQRLAEWSTWEPLARSADFPE